MPKAGFISLGCPKNLVDSEVMMGVLARNGYEFTPRAEEADAAREPVSDLRPAPLRKSVTAS